MMRASRPASPFAAASCAPPRPGNAGRHRPALLASSAPSPTVADVFTFGGLVIGVVAGFVVGVSKTAMPGAGLVVTPLIAAVVSGRAIPGTVLPILIAADLFAVAWYREHARWDLLRGLITWVALGFAAGAVFFVAAGTDTRTLEVMIAAILLLVVALQIGRVVRRRPPRPATAATAAAFGTTGGFTTFVSNTAGPIMNSYLLGLGLDKHELIGTSAWFYVAINVAKIPLYVALGEWSDGGRFFTWQSLTYDAVLVPAVIAGVYSGRSLFARLPQLLFMWLVHALSAAGALKLALAP